MSEEMREELQTNETAEAVENTSTEAAENETAEAGAGETMADYEEHFDDANPWNRVQEYMEKKTHGAISVFQITLFF